MFIICPKCGDNNDIPREAGLRPGDQFGCFSCGYIITKR